MVAGSPVRTASGSGPGQGRKALRDVTLSDLQQLANSVADLAQVSRYRGPLIAKSLEHATQWNQDP